MTDLQRVFLLQMLVIFLFIFLLLLVIYGRKTKKELKIKERKRLFRAFDFKTVLFIVLAAAALTVFLSKITNSQISNALIFMLVLFLAPLMITNAQNRIRSEHLFSEITLFCQNVCMLLKQTRNVYDSIEKASEDLTTVFKDDVRALLPALETGKERTKEVMEILETNYPYSCVRNLNVIILHMFYESANVEESLLSTYQDDVTALEQDVKENKTKRKGLRLSYIGLTVGSLLSYYFFISNISDHFGLDLDTPTFRIVTVIYLFATLIAFFFVDRYFNSQITKE